MPVVIFLACLDLEQKSSFLDGHYLKLINKYKHKICQKAVYLIVKNPGF
jgi:hypothetical protein